MSASNKKSAKAHRPKDQRPKIISFSTTLHGLNIAARQSILWPCHAFNISIPQKKKSALNVFEQTVLKITEIASGDTAKIAQLTCLETELVAFIQNRLQQLGLLSERYELSAEGNKLLASWRSKDEEAMEYVAATIFIDLHAGKPLPYLHVGPLRHEKIIAIDEQFITIELGSTGKSKSIPCRNIIPDKDSFWKVAPDSNDVIKVIKSFKKKYQRRVLLNQNADQYPPSLPMAGAITVDDKPELVYLHCQAVIQRGNSEHLLVTDGCGFGFSESFADYLTSQNWKWVTQLKEKGIIDKLNPGQSQSNDNAKSYQYPEISRRITASKGSLAEVKLNPSSTHDEKKNQGKIENGIKNLYAGLEWALRQVVADNAVPTWQQIFASQDFRENEKLLSDFAQKVGFSVNDKNKRLLQVKLGAIRQIDHGKVELQPLLALSIAGAINNTNHPIRRLANNHSGFLDHALNLKKYRDPIEHGSTAKLNMDQNTLKELIDRTIPMIIALVPGVSADLNMPNQSVSEGDPDQQRLAAQVSLEKELGLPLVSAMSPDIKEQLIRAEMMLQSYADDQGIEIITCYASVMQHVLFEVMKDHRIDYEGEDMKQQALENIVQAGFYGTCGEIPKEISTVNNERLDRAVRAVNITLGANLLAVFLLTPYNKLAELQKSDPKFVGFVANLIQLRGHSNHQQFGGSRDDIGSLKNTVFKAIKTITEVF